MPDCDELPVVDPDGLTLMNRAALSVDSTKPVCHLRIKARFDTPGWLVLALRPYNPEGAENMTSLRSGHE